MSRLYSQTFVLGPPIDKRLILESLCYSLGGLIKKFRVPMRLELPAISRMMKALAMTTFRC